MTLLANAEAGEHEAPILMACSGGTSVTVPEVLGYKSAGSVGDRLTFECVPAVKSDALGNCPLVGFCILRNALR